MRTPRADRLYTYLLSVLALAEASYNQAAAVQTAGRFSVQALRTLLRELLPHGFDRPSRARRHDYN